MALSMVPGARCYVPDEKHIWLPAEVISSEGKKIEARVFLPEGGKENRNIDLNDKKILQLISGDASKAVETLPLQNEDSTGRGIADMTSLSYLHEPAILYNIKTRFLASQPYTYTGDIVIAVNPYKWMPELYNEDQHHKYLEMEREDLPPHVYSTSIGAYRDMRDFDRNQSVLVSGESGAGKTETTKIVMGHLATIAGGVKDSTITRIIAVNPLLESFGNAKTVRNDNSSRFGKFTQLQFDKNAILVGAKVQTYLLEKTRVVQHMEGERNYHIFYQLLFAPNAADYLLDPKVDYVYMGGSKNETARDAPTYDVTVAALRAIGVTDDRLRILLRTVSATLHLGEIKLKPKASNDEESEVANPNALGSVCELLGVSPDAIERAFCTRTMRARNEVYSVQLKASDAADCRDALAKALYSNIFNWLVQAMNNSLSNDKRAQHQVGILDIFGFEHFKHNSFEQFCINYANEKLQQKFTQDVFKTVQIEYEEEGVTWDHIDFKDNQDVLDVIESKMGIISLLNEEVMRPRGTEESFVSKLQTLHKDDEAQVIDFIKTSRTKFAIRHYAGVVTYEALGFLDKHKDALLPDLADLMRSSSIGYVVDIFTDKDASPSSGPQRRSLASSTVGTQFKTSLTDLMANIQSTKVHYIRCIKPNPKKSSTEMDLNQVVGQLRCAGVIEAIRISRAGYPNKMLHSQFLSRFKLFVTKNIVGNPREMCDKVMLGFNYASPKNYQLGRTKIYFQFGVLEELEDRRKKFLDQKAAFLQRIMRGFVAVIRYKRQRYAIVKLQAVFRCFHQMRRYEIMKKGIGQLQARWRGYQGRKVALELRRQRGATMMQKAVRGYLWRKKYLRWRSSAIKIQSFVRMVLQRPKYLSALEEKKRETDLQYQLQALQERLKEEQQRAQDAITRAQQEAREAALRESNSSVNAEMRARRNSVAQDVMADAGGMISTLQQENQKLRDQLSQYRAQADAYKRDLDKLKAEKEYVEATSHVKIRKLEGELNDKEKVAARYRDDAQKWKDQLFQLLEKQAEKEAAELEKQQSKSYFRTLGSKKDEGQPTETVDNSDASQGSISKWNFLGFAQSKIKGPAAAPELPADQKAVGDEVQRTPDITSPQNRPSAPATDNRPSLLSLGAAARKSTTNYFSGGIGGLTNALQSMTVSIVGGPQGGEKPTPAAAPESLSLDSLDEPLPPGWIAKVSRSKGRVYYCNPRLGITQWTKPTVESLKAQMMAEEKGKDQGQKAPGKP